MRAVVLKPRDRIKAGPRRRRVRVDRAPQQTGAIEEVVREEPRAALPDTEGMRESIDTPTAGALCKANARNTG